MEKELKAISARIPLKLYSEIERDAAELGLSMADIIRFRLKSRCPHCRMAYQR